MRWQLRSTHLKQPEPSQHRRHRLRRQSKLGLEGREDARTEGETHRCDESEIEKVEDVLHGGIEKPDEQVLIGEKNVRWRCGEEG